MNLEKQRSNSNTLFSVQRKNDPLHFTSNPQEILGEIKDHFSQIYSTHSHDKDDESLNDIFVNREGAGIIDVNDKFVLNSILSEGEILRALKQSKNSSSPGLDGLPCEVYKFFWNNIKGPLIASFNYSFDTGELSTSQRRSIICLHHKGKGLPREVISNWRPISLTNADYKLITKTLTNRSNVCIYKLIESDQFAFIKGRQVADLLREIDDILEHGKEHFPNSIILSLDYAKAFDTLTLKAIKKALLYFDLGEVFIKWIDIILKNRQCCVRNGGYISNLFEMERGVRQGCPISPLLFILTLELLARDIRKSDKIEGIKLYPRCSPIKIRMYADDATLFLKNVIDYREVLSRIKMFTRFSGLSLNVNKTTAMYFGDSSQKGTMKFGIKCVNSIKILGVIFSNENASINIKENFDHKISKLERICNLWEKRNLTLFGKVTILKTFGISQFIYIMQSIGISDENLVKINRILFRFIWLTKTNNGKKVTEKVKRETVCSMLEEGGLNMIDIKKMQDSFLLKWADKLLVNKDDTKDEIYSWKTIPILVFKPVGGISAFNSSVHSSKFKGLDLIKSLFWKRVLKIWLHYNSSDDRQFSVCHPIFNNSFVKFKNNTIFIERCIRKSMVLIKDFIENNEILKFDSFCEKFGLNAETHLAYNIIFNALKKIETAIIENNQQSQSFNEEMFFRNVEVGSTSRKGYYNLINEKKVTSIISELRERFLIQENDPNVWSVAPSCTSEVKLLQLQWKILHNIYPTGTLLKKMKIRQTENCQICGERDSLSHFFAECPIAKKIWREVELVIYNLSGIKIKLNEKMVMVGILKGDDIVLCNPKSLDIINRVILIGKHTISKFKVDNSGNPLILLENELWIRNLLKNH